MLKILYRKKALKGLKKMPAEVCAGFLEGFRRLADGKSRGLDVRPLTGRDGYRLRIREWRAIYEIRNDQLIILVLDAGPRGGIYR